MPKSSELPTFLKMIKNLSPTLPEFKGAVLPGIASAIVSMLAAIGFGMLSGMGVEAGMVTSIIIGLVGGYLGGADLLIRATTGAIVIIVADMLGRIAQIPGIDAQTTSLFLILAFSTAALVQYLIGKFNFGSAIFYVPQSIVKGFISGVGLLIIQAQWIRLTGLSSLERFFSLEVYAALSERFISGYGLLFLCTFLLMKFGKKLFPKIPALLTATFFGILLQSVFKFDVAGIGTANQSSYLVNLGNYWLNFDFQQSWGIISTSTALLFDTLLLGVTIAFISSMDALMIAVAAERMGQGAHSPNKELKALGLGNFFSALFLGLPGSGIMGGTVVNIISGAKDRWAGIISSLFILIILLFFKDMVMRVPAVVIDTIIFLVGFQLIDKAFVKNLTKVPVSDRIVFVLVLFVTVAFNLIYAILIGFSIASIVFMKKMSDVITDESKSTDYNRMQKKLIAVLEKDADEQPLMQRIEIKQIKGPLFFGVTNSFSKSLQSLDEKVEYVLLNFQLVPYIDFSGVDEIIRLKKELNAKKIRVIFCGLNKESAKSIAKFGLIKEDNKSDIRPSLESALLMIHLIETDREALVDQEGVMQSVLDTDDEILSEWRGNDWIESEQYLEILDKRNRIVHDTTGNEPTWQGKYKQRIACVPGLYKVRVLDADKEKVVIERIIALV